MIGLLQLLSVCLFASVGLISLNMAAKSLRSRSFLSFHAAAYGNSWDSVDGRLQAVILALLRTVGLGFLVVGLLLLLVPIIDCFVPLSFFAVLSPILSLLFCFGLGVVNHRLHQQTGAKTPWKESFFASAMIMAGIILSMIQKS